jgi:hypothetical protein
MTVAQALGFVEKHGIVLESARHAKLPSLAEAIAGEPLRGSWWSHPKSRAIFALTRAVRESPDVLVCRLVDDRINFVHARLWPALVRSAERFAPARLARVIEQHSNDGAHRIETIAFPRWVPAETSAAAQRLSQARARAELARLLPELEETT